MLSYLYRRITTNKGAPRLWLEGKQPARAGFAAGVRYALSVHPETRTVTLTLKDNGWRVVSAKHKGDTDVPVIDLNSREALGIFDGIELVRVIIRKGRIHILPAIAELRRRERLARLEAALAAKEPISIGSVSHGIGVLDLAIHQGLAAGGVASRLAFANDIDDEFLTQASEHNPAWNEDTAYLSVPVQLLPADTWAMGALPKIHGLIGGIPCSGASVAGRAKLGTSCAEAHEGVGHLVVPFIQMIQALNPAFVCLENVTPWSSAGSAWILRHSLRDMGYEVHETVLKAKEWNALEHRERFCLVAVTQGMQFSFAELEKPAPQARTLGEILEPIADDDPAWSSFDYLKNHVAKHAAKGNGFQLQVFRPEDDHVGTLTAGYAKIRATDPKIAHASNPDLMRQLTVNEHAGAKDIEPELVAGMSKTAAHRAMGQSVSKRPFVALGKLLAHWLRQPFTHATQATVTDLLAAA